jgi:hypothetical protein
LDGSERLSATAWRASLASQTPRDGRTAAADATATTPYPVAHGKTAYQGEKTRHTHHGNGEG